MASLDMEGPFDYDSELIDLRVHRGTVGTFALGNMNGRGGLEVGYVGRSETDLNVELKRHLPKTKFRYFKFRYASSAIEAFDRECKAYHDFHLEKKQPHPARLANIAIVCPVCLE